MIDIAESVQHLSLAEWHASHWAAAEGGTGIYTIWDGAEYFPSVDSFIDEMASRFGFDCTRIMPFVRTDTHWPLTVMRRESLEDTLCIVQVTAANVLKVIKEVAQPYG